MIYRIGAAGTVNAGLSSIIFNPAGTNYSYVCN
jgi:hypothetical protein